MPNSKVTGNIVGKKLRQYREKRAISQVELSAMLIVDFGIEISSKLISDIEATRRPVRDKELQAFIKILQIDPRDLFECGCEFPAA